MKKLFLFSGIGSILLMFSMFAYGYGTATVDLTNGETWRCPADLIAGKRTRLIWRGTLNRHCQLVGQSSGFQTNGNTCPHPDNYYVVSDFLSAAESGDTHKLRELMDEKCVDVNTADIEGMTALMKASMYGQITAVQMLLAEGADVNAVDISGRSALYLAVTHYKEQEEVVQMLLAGGADVNGGDFQPALIPAARKGYAKIVQMLLAEGADVDAVDSVGQTALTVAVEAGQIKIVRILIAGGADVKFANSKPLKKAIQRGHAQIVQMLLAGGADDNGVDVLAQTHARARIIREKALYNPPVRRLFKEGRDFVVVTDRDGKSYFQVRLP